MKYKNFMVAAADVDGTAEVNAFLSSHRILNCKDDLTSINGIPFVVYRVTYEDSGTQQPSAKMAASFAQQKALAGTETHIFLPIAHFEIFQALRDWRLERTREEKIPSYALFGNIDLLRITQLPAFTEAQLGKIHGIGPAKMKKYGKTICALLSGFQPAGPLSTEKQEQIEAAKMGGRVIVALEGTEEVEGEKETEVAAAPPVEQAESKKAADKAADMFAAGVAEDN